MAEEQFDAIEALEAAAKATVPEIWTHEPVCDDAIDSPFHIITESGRVLGVISSAPAAYFIAAANPAAVLELIAELRNTKKTLEVFEEYVDIVASRPWRILDLIAELRQARAERDWLAVNLANGLVDPGCIEHLAELGGMSPPDPATLIEAAKEATCRTN